MAKSPFFARIKADVLKIVEHVPVGRVLTFADIGAHLDVVPRHVAYILATLEDEKKATLPWHRVVADMGKFGTPKFAPDGTPQEELLRGEGWHIRKGQLAEFQARVMPVAELNSGVPKQSRPADAPRS